MAFYAKKEHLAWKKMKAVLMLETNYVSSYQIKSVYSYSEWIHSEVGWKCI